MRYFFIENKISDSQEEAKLCFSSIFPDGEEVYNRQKHQLPYTRGLGNVQLPFFQIKDPISRQLWNGIINKHILMRLMIN